MIWHLFQFTGIRVALQYGPSFILHHVSIAGHLVSASVGELRLWINKIVCLLIGLSLKEPSHIGLHLNDLVLILLGVVQKLLQVLRVGYLLVWSNVIWVDLFDISVVELLMERVFILVVAAILLISHLY